VVCPSVSRVERVLKCLFSEQKCWNAIGPKGVLNPTCPSQTPLVEEGVHRRCSQMPFAADTFQKNYQIEIRTIQYISLPWATIRPRQQGQPTFSNPLLFDPSLIEGGRRRPSWRGGDGPTYCWKKEVDRVELERKIIREHWFSYRLEREARSHWSMPSWPIIYVHRSELPKGKLDDPMNGQVNDPAWKLWCSKTSFSKFDHCLGDCRYVVNVRLYGARMWMSHGLRFGPFGEYVRTLH
jgi:hypothetical protein